MRSARNPSFGCRWGAIKLPLPTHRSGDLTFSNGSMAESRRRAFGCRDT